MIDELFIFLILKIKIKNKIKLKTTMEIDNFDIFKKHLTFKEKTDRYIVHILRRPKDLIGCQYMKDIGSNEHQRLLRTYYIDSIEYFEKKIPAIKELCITNKARAYILPQVRNNFECLLSLGEKVLETIRLGNFSAKPEHLLRSAYCEYHKSRDKQWIIDLDDDCMVEYIYDADSGYHEITKKIWTVDEVLKLVQDNLVECGKDPELAYVVKTKSGHHIITSPFDLQKAFMKCSMLYEGEHKNVVVDKVWIGPGEYELKREKSIVGWLHKDGMSLLYMNL